MIEKDHTPVDSVAPNESLRLFLVRLMEETRDYARSKNYNDMVFQGHVDHPYFGAYSTQVARRGVGKFIFGFERRRMGVRMAIPIDIPEPFRLAKSWTGDPSRNRAVIEVREEPNEEMQLYLIYMGKRSIDFHYE
jgi:hypothetical protein